MLQKSLFAASLLFLVCSVPMVAQQNRRTPNSLDAALATPTLQQNQLLRIPPLSNARVATLKTRSPVVEAQVAQAPKIFVSPETLRMSPQGTPGDGVCYTLRERRFREPEEGSNIPRPNGSVTCTSGSELHMKSIEVYAAK